jgi:hypothetical protein
MHAVNVKYVAEQLKCPVWILFNVAYAHSYKIFDNRYHDVGEFKQKGTVPQYVQDFIYSIVAEVHDAE